MLPITRAPRRQPARAPLRQDRAAQSAAPIGRRLECGKGPFLSVGTGRAHDHWLPVCGAGPDAFGAFAPSMRVWISCMMQLLRPTISLLRSALAASLATLSGLERSGDGADPSAPGGGEAVSHLLGWPSIQETTSKLVFEIFQPSDSP